MGFYVGANYIFGLPDDDNDTMKETLDLSLRINSEWQIFTQQWLIQDPNYIQWQSKKNGNFQMIKMARGG